MRILALDPGPTKTAICVYDTESHRPLSHGVLSSEKIPSFLKSEAFDLVACECVTGYGAQSVGAETFETCRWEGKYEMAAGERPFRRVRRRDVKSHLCENPTAKDSDVNAALIARYGEKGTKKAPGTLYGFGNDERAALAVAIYAAEVPIDPAKTWDGRPVL